MQLTLTFQDQIKELKWSGVAPSRIDISSKQWINYPLKGPEIIIQHFGTVAVTLDNTWCQSEWISKFSTG